MPGPAPDAKAVQTILADTNRYKAESLPALESHAEAQVKSGSYDLDVNLAVLKLYQFFPDRTNIGIVAKILVKALMNMPHPDFMLCMCLIPERHHGEEPIMTISNLANALETCDFVKFWAESKTAEDFLTTIPGFEEAIRKYILGVLRITYQRIQEGLLCKYLRLDPSQLDNFLKPHGLKVANGFVQFELNADNTAKSQKIVEGASIEQMARIIAQMRS